MIFDILEDKREENIRKRKIRIKITKLTRTQEMDVHKTVKDT